MSTLTSASSSLCRISSKLWFPQRCFRTLKSNKCPTQLHTKCQQIHRSATLYLCRANSRAGSKIKTIVLGTSLAFLGFGAAKEDKTEDEVTKKYEKKEEKVDDRIHHELVKAEEKHALAAHKETFPIRCQRMLNIELTKQVIKGMILYHRAEYEDAAQTLKKSLELSDNMYRDKLITETDNLNHHCFIENTLANHAYKLQQYSNAKVHFTECIKTCVRLGMAPNDNAVIDMSIKLAVCFNYLQNDEFAKEGFRYSILEQQKKIEADPDVDEDTLALLGMAYEELGRFYLQKNYFIDGETLLLKALDICKKVMGEADEQCLRILNDIATCNVMQAKYAEAEEMLKDGIKLGQKTKSLIEVAFRSNLGAVYLRQEKYKEAEHECKIGLNIAIKAKDEYFQIPCRECLRKVDYMKNMSNGEKLRKTLHEEKK